MVGSPPLGIHVGDESCRYCGSATIPLIVPPLFPKPVMEDALIRTIWGLARKKLAEAEAAVLIGFSAAPTDFYASWILRTTVGVRPDANVIVVNPANDPGHTDHQMHTRRMASIFAAQARTNQFNSQFQTFAEIEKIVDFLCDKGYIRRSDTALSH